ncbi:MAG: hypothetical protein D6734_09235 [Candidatus Schekmanbacteria bacterium]|nr:MAG: hypothetical protein D6734_09235 [Candidatus Schekmanbacteria bacterium]
MYNESWKGLVDFYELAFGSWIAYIFLVWMWRKLLKYEHQGWRYSLALLLSASFYIINHYFLRAPFYNPLIWSYTIFFIIVWYFLFVHSFPFSTVKKIFAFLSNFLFAAVYVLAENIARWAHQGKIIRGVEIPEFIFMIISCLATLGIILSHRKKG